MKHFDELLSAVYSTTVTDASVLVRQVRLRVGVLTKFVTVQIYYDGKQAEPFSFEISDSMKTPVARDTSETQRTAPTEIEALRRAVRTLTDVYEDAVRRGEMPDDAWLVRDDVSRDLSR